MDELITSELQSPAPSANGAQPAAPPLGPQVQRREQWVDLPAEGYPGFRFKMWLNYPQRLQRQLVSGDERVTEAAFARIVLETNGWRDEEGTPYPPPTYLPARHPEGHEHAGERVDPNDFSLWELIPTELAIAITRTMGDAVLNSLPNSRAPTRPRSGSG